MDPNTNQFNNQPIINQQQASTMPQNPVETGLQQGVQYQNTDIKKSNKAVLILIVLLLLVVGLTFYLIFANMKSTTPQNPPAVNVQVIPPTPIPPTPQPAEDDLSVEDPEVDLKTLDDAAATL